MLNSISLVGKIVKNVYHVENMAFIDIEVKRPFPEEIGKEKFDVFEYEFLTNLYLKDIIVGYFIINNKWLPKDKKLFKSLKDENIELFRLCKKVIETYEYKDLINVYKYIFI